MQRAYSHGRALTDLLQKVMVDMPTQATLDVLHEVSEARQGLSCCCGSKGTAIFFVCTKHWSPPHDCSSTEEVRVGVSWPTNEHRQRRTIVRALTVWQMPL